MTETTSSGTERFAVLPLVAATYRTMLADAGLFLATIWPIALVMLAIDVATSLLSEPWMSTARLVAGFAALAIYAPFTVAWTRRVLGRDAPTGIGVLVYDAAAWRVLKLQMLLLGISVVAFAVMWAVIVALRAAGAPMAAPVLIILGAAVYVYVLTRWGIVLTVAVEEDRKPLSRSWALTRGRVFRIAMGSILAIFLPGAAAGFLNGLLPEGQDMLAAFPRILASSLASYVFLGLTITYAAFVYRALVPPGAPLTATD